MLIQDTTPSPDNLICETHGHVFLKENSHWACRRCGRAYEEIWHTEQFDWPHDDEMGYHA